MKFLKIDIVLRGKMEGPHIWGLIAVLALVALVGVIVAVAKVI